MWSVDDRVYYLLTRRFKMKSNRLIGLSIVLISITILMQGWILYRQYLVFPAKNVFPQIRDAERNTIIDSTDLQIQGSDKAGIVLLEFSDYECPSCQLHAAGAGRQVQKKYVSAGRIRHAFVNFPLPMHQHATQMAAAAICAGKQDAYWKMHDLLFEDKPTTKDAMLTEAKRLGLNLSRFEECLDNDTNWAKAIDQDVKIAKRFNITGTPTFALGRVESSNRIRISKIISGALPFGVFEMAIDEAVRTGAKSQTYFFSNDLPMIAKNRIQP
jgi:protein-disulfide isomerase